MEKTRHISYRRVSTEEQGISHLGLDAQKYQIAKVFGEPFLDFVEVKSRTNNTRAKLTEAIKLCKKYNCFLSVSRQDRLSGDAHFVLGLMKDGLDFRAADNPNAGDFIKHIYSAISEDEVKKIRQRTKAALDAKKVSGWKGGVHTWKPENVERLKEITDKARAARSYYQVDLKKVKTLQTLKKAGNEFIEIEETAEYLFGKKIAKSTIYKYLSMKLPQ